MHHGQQQLRGRRHGAGKLFDLLLFGTMRGAARRGGDARGEDRRIVQTVSASIDRLALQLPIRASIGLGGEASAAGWIFTQRLYSLHAGSETFRALSLHHHYVRTGPAHT
jgi:hypothetical protein